jgi:aerobic carbon-monoxide dehydrogenase medium subunit
MGGGEAEARHPVKAFAPSPSNGNRPMKPPAFSYHDPKTVAEVIALLSALDNAKLLAGGQSLMPMLNFRFVQPDHIIDLNRVEGLSYIRETAEGMEVGAMTRQRDLEFSPLVGERFPLLHEAIRSIGHRQTRNRGTIGGSLCHLDAAAELVSCALTFDTVAVVEGPSGPRDIAFKDFPAGYLTPAISSDELLTAIRFTAWPAGHGCAFEEFARRHGDFAIVSAAVLLQADGAGRITRAAITLGGMGAAPVRAVELEAALIGRAPDPAFLQRACERCRSFEALDDVHATAVYRQHLATVMSRRALERAYCRAIGKR